MTRLETLASNALVEQLNNDGLAANYTNGSISTGLSEVTITCLVEHVDNSIRGNFKSKVLFRAAGEQAMSVTISTNGTAESEDESVLEAVRNYAQHFWPVFRAALAPDEEKAERRERKEKQLKDETDSDVLVDTARLTSLCDGKFIAWDVFLGPYRVEGSRSDFVARIHKERAAYHALHGFDCELSKRKKSSLGRVETLARRQ